MHKLIYLLFFIPILVLAYEVDCNAYDSDTGEYVYGSCNAGGSLDAYNSDTGEYVYGDCDSA